MEKRGLLAQASLLCENLYTQQNARIVARACVNPARSVQLPKPPVPGTVHISCSFSFAIRASAHESPLSLPSFLPPSLSRLLFSPLALPRSLSIWNANEERFCGCLHPSRGADRGAPQLCPLKAQIKVQSVIYSPPVNRFWARLSDRCDPSRRQKFGFTWSALLDRLLWRRNFEGKSVQWRGLVNVERRNCFKGHQTDDRWSDLKENCGQSAITRF